MTLTHPHPRHAALAAAAVLAAALVACGQKDDQTAGQKLDSAIAKTEAAARDAQAQAESAMTDAKNAAQQAGQDVKQAAQDAVADAKQAANQASQEIKQGAGTLKAEAADAANQVAAVADDAAITAAVTAGLVKDPALSALKINVDTKDGQVTLQGTAPTDADKTRAEAIARDVKGVKSVSNKLSVSG